MADIKNMLQQLLQSSKAPSTASSSAPTINELWQLFQPVLHQQRKYVDQQHEIQLQMFINVMDARYKDTQADIKAIKTHILQTTGTSPPTIIYVKNLDDAKKGEKGKEGLHLEPDPKAKLVVEIPRPDGTKDVDVTLNLFAEQKANRKERMEQKGSKRFAKEKKVLMAKEVLGTSNRRKKTKKVSQPKITPTKTIKHTSKIPKSSSPQTSKPTDVETPVISIAVDTSVVSTDVVSTTALITLPTTTKPKTTLPSQKPLAKKQKTTVDTSKVVMTTVVETPVASTIVS
ncbi:hypothetical protein Hanom_Chr03g00206351 [Helianthus anomalus]